MDDCSDDANRKINVDAILTGDNLSMDTLKRYCIDEIKNGFNSEKEQDLIHE